MSDASSSSSDSGGVDMTGSSSDEALRLRLRRLRNAGILQQHNKTKHDRMIDIASALIRRRCALFLLDESRLGSHLVLEVALQTAMRRRARAQLLLATEQTLLAHLQRTRRHHDHKTSMHTIQWVTCG